MVRVWNLLGQDDIVQVVVFSKTSMKDVLQVQNVWMEGTGRVGIVLETDVINNYMVKVQIRTKAGRI